jgi:hypothetical protein
MRRLALVGAVALLLPLPVTASAQSSEPASTTAEVRANVLSPLALSRVGTTDFGNFDANAHVETIDPVNPGNRSTAQFTATGSANVAIVVSFDATVPICVQGGGCAVASMTFTPNVASSPTNDQASATANLVSGTDVQLSASGTHYFWLGGLLQVNAGQRPGQYSGTFTLSTAYQ